MILVRYIANCNWRRQWRFAKTVINRIDQDVGEILQ